MTCKKIAIIVMSLCVAAFTFSCKGTGSDADTITIGALFSVTGPASFLGAPEKKTAEMVVEEINAKGGIAGKKVRLIVKDTGGSPEKAVSFAKQLIEENKVFAIIGPSTSGESLQIKELCDNAKTILLSCAAAEKIVNPVAPFVFSTAQMDRFAILRIFGVMKDLGIKKIGVISANTGFGKAGNDQIAKLAPKAGIQIVISEVYDKDATDLSGVLTKIKDKKVQALVNWSIEPIQSIVAKNMKQIGLDITLFQSHGFGNVKYAAAAGAAGDGIIFPGGHLLIADSLPASHPQSAILTAYTKAYESRYGEDASGFGGYAHDALLILSKAIEKVGLDRDKVREAIESTTGLVGVSGIYNYTTDNHNGLNESAFEILSVKNSKFVQYVKGK